MGSRQLMDRRASQDRRNPWGRPSPYDRQSPQGSPPPIAHGIAAGSPLPTRLPRHPDAPLGRASVGTSEIATPPLTAASPAVPPRMSASPEIPPTPPAMPRHHRCHGITSGASAGRARNNRRRALVAHSTAIATMTAASMTKTGARCSKGWALPDPSRRTIPTGPIVVKQTLGARAVLGGPGHDPRWPAGARGPGGPQGHSGAPLHGALRGRGRRLEDRAVGREAHRDRSGHLVRRRGATDNSGATDAARTLRPGTLRGRADPTPRPTKDEIL